VQFSRDKTLPVAAPAVPAPLADDLAAEIFSEGSFCYALLDGAQVNGLPNLLEFAGADATSLFCGDSMADFAEAGPWLVELRKNDRLCGMLFTASPAPQHLWGKLRFTLLRSSAATELLVNHLRRYIRLRRADGSMPLFRFWDGQILADYFEGCASQPRRAARLFGHDGQNPLITTFLIATEAGDGLIPYRLAGPIPAGAQRSDQTLDAFDEGILRAAADKRIVARVGKKLKDKIDEIDPAQVDLAQPYAKGAMAFIRRFGTGHVSDIEKDCFQLALVAFLLGPSWRTVSQGPLMREPLVPMSQRIALLRESYFAALAAAPPEKET
jgi:hypothetical protein